MSESPDRPNPDEQLQSIEVTDPRLSASTRAQVTADAREAVGADEAVVREDEPHPSRGDRQLGAGPLLDLTNNRLLLRSILGSAVVVAMIIALTTYDWWLLPIAFVVLAAMTGSIAMMIIRTTKVPEHPSPQTAAALNEDGVRSPDEYFSAVVTEFTQPDPDADGEDRTQAVEDDHHTASAQQSASSTPTGGRSRAVGPSTKAERNSGG